MQKTAEYRIITGAEGMRFCFYCGISGALVYTTGPIFADNQEHALEIAWKTEGREHFDLCHKCGKWVMGTMYNADVLECVKCAPWENLPNFCSQCGAKLIVPRKECPVCGHTLRYEGEQINVK